MKRKTAICKCGRTVECQPEQHCSWCQETWYAIGCECGIKTDICPTPLAAWVEWKRLQKAKP